MPQIELDQPNFGLGMFMGWDPLSIPDGGSYDIENAMQGDDGMLIRRGGPTDLTASFSPKGLRWIWSGHVSAGYRVLIANQVGMGAYVHPSTFVGLGTNGDASMLWPVLPALVEGYLFIPATTSRLLIYAGSLMAGSYNTGTVDLVAGSTTVIGTGTLFADNLDAGALLIFTAGSNQGVFAVRTVNNQTSLELDRAWTGSNETATGYTATAVHDCGGGSGTPYPNGNGSCANVANRLVLGDSNYPDYVYFSNVGSAHEYGQFNYHRLPEGRSIRAIQPLGQSAAIFTDNDVWRLDGLPFEIVSPDGTPQHQLQRLVGEDLVVPQCPMSGISPYQDGLIVPCLDGVFLLDQQGTATRLSRSVDAMYASMLISELHNLPDIDPPAGGPLAGSTQATLGGSAIYDDHYFLPFIGSSASANRILTVLVCRLDRPRETELGVVFPWSRFSGNGANVSAYTVASLGQDGANLLGASNVDEGDSPAPLGLTAAIIDAGSYFYRLDNTSQDPDGTNYLFQVTPRLIPTGEGLDNVVRHAKLFYEMDDGYSTDPQLDLLITSDYASYESIGFVGENPVAALAPRHRVGPPRRRHMALRIESDQRTDKLIVRSIRYFVRPSLQRRS